ncbi:hypothetical protein CRYUN_Cryun21dG0055700 [Craigia yunnanensis]
MTRVGTYPECLQAIVDDLEHYERSLKLNFEVSIMISNLENLKPEDFSTSTDKALPPWSSTTFFNCIVW